MPQFVSVAGEKHTHTYTHTHTHKRVGEKESLARKVTSAVSGKAATAMSLIEIQGKEQLCPP